MAPLALTYLGTAGALGATAGAGVLAAKGLDRLSGAEGARADAESRQNMANYNAKVQEQEAAAKRTATKFASKRQAEQAHREKSMMLAKGAKDGGVGSLVFEDIQAGQAAELELEGLLLGFEGETMASKAGKQGDMDIASGKAARQRGKSQSMASQVRFGTTLLQGFA